MTYGPTHDPGAVGRPAPAGGISRVWALVAVVVLAVVLLIGWWLWQGGNVPIQQLRSTSLGLILQEPATHEAERVVVSGRVERLLTDSVMTLGSDLVDGEVLVLTPPGVFLGPAGGVGPGVGGAAAPVGGVGGVGGAGLFLEGQFVQVTGTVRAFDSTTMSEEFGLVLAPDLFEPFEGAPAIITEAFDIAFHGAQVPAPVEPGVVDVGAVLAEPQTYAGQAVRVEGGLGESFSEHAFTLTAPESEGALLVVGEGTGGLVEVAPGHPVRVEGTVLAFDEEALRQETVELGEGVDYSSFEGQPAIIASLVEVLESQPAAATPPAEQTPAQATSSPAAAP